MYTSVYVYIYIGLYSLSSLYDSYQNKLKTLYKVYHFNHVSLK